MHATEESEALIARGQIELHAGRAQAALTLFQQAIDADPSDINARYYHAVAAGELGDRTTAISELRAVLAARPTFAPAALGLGTALIESGEYEEAIRWLQQAQQDPQLDAKASFALGLAELRRERNDAARADFQRARERDPQLALASHYYEGVADYRAGNSARASDHFSYVTETSPDSVLGQEAASYLALLRRGRVGKYSLYGSVALTYDSNVTIAPDNQVAAGTVSGQADGAVNLNFGGVYVPWENDQFTLSLGYDFYQSLYFELHDFNLQDHRPLAQLVWNPGPVQIGLLGRYDYYLQETSSLLEDITGLLWMGIPEEGFGRSDASFRIRDRNSFESDFKALDGVYYAAHVGQAFELWSPSRLLVVGLQLDSDDTRPFSFVPEGSTTNMSISCRDAGNCDEYTYNGIQTEIGLVWRFTPTLEAQAGYRYRNENYAEGSVTFPPDGSGRRQDQEHRAAFSINQQLTELLWLNLAYLGTWNNSNKVSFQYNRQIGLVGVEVRL